MELEEIRMRVAAKALYDGGWRSGDKAELTQEYEYDDTEAEELCQLLQEIEEEEKEELKAKAWALAEDIYYLEGEHSWDKASLMEQKGYDDELAEQICKFIAVIEQENGE